MKSKYSKVIITVWVVNRKFFNDERLVADREIPTEIIPDDASTFDFFTDFRKISKNDKCDYAAFARNFKITAISDKEIAYVENGNAQTSPADRIIYFVTDYDKSDMLSFQFALYL